MIIFLVFCYCLEVEVAGMAIFCLGWKKMSRHYWSSSLMGFWWCFQGQRNNLLLISTLRPCLCDLVFIFSPKLHWFSALIFLHLYLIQIQKCVNDTWIVPLVLRYWKFSLHWLRMCFQAYAFTQQVKRTTVNTRNKNRSTGNRLVQNEHTFLETKLSSTAKDLIAL